VDTKQLVSELIVVGLERAAYGRWKGRVKQQSVAARNQLSGTGL